jgi:hypothetical protein
MIIADLMAMPASRRPSKTLAARKGTDLLAQFPRVFPHRPHLISRLPAQVVAQKSGSFVADAACIALNIHRFLH